MIDLDHEPVVLTPVPESGPACKGLYMPALLLADDVVFAYGTVACAKGWVWVNGYTGYLPALFEAAKWRGYDTEVIWRTHI